ncbi:MAG: cytochrome P450 [Myxococcota bacterium]
MTDLYYDPYDFAIDEDPYPIWRRLQDEAPLYYNEKYDFYALSRFDDVEAGLKDWQNLSSARGSVLEIIRNGVEIPPGSILFEDPPSHDLHRGLLAKLFTPRQIRALEPKIRAFCEQSLDPLVGAGGFDFIADLGAQMPMKTIGMLLGVPEEDQEAIRDRIDAGLKLEGGKMPEKREGRSGLSFAGFEKYIDYRMENPSDDLMTELIQAEFVDAQGETRRLGRREIVGFVGLLAGAGNETTTRLIGWAGKVLAEHPEQRARLAADPSLVPQAVEELLRFEAPSPVQARYVTRDVAYHGGVVPEGRILILLNGAANRDPRQFEDPDRFDIDRKIDQHLSFGYGIHFCLGAALARLEGRIALEEVLKRWPEWEVDWDNAVQAHTSTVRGWEKLPVRTV